MSGDVFYYVGLTVLFVSMVGATVVVFGYLFEFRSARQRLLERMRQNRALLERARAAKLLTTSHVVNTSQVDRKEVEELRKMIEGDAAELGARDRGLILDALHQPDARGQIRFVQDLLQIALRMESRARSQGVH